MSLLEIFVTTQLVTFLMVFARIGCAMMLLPGFSDTTVPVEVRLFLALGLSFIFVPVLQPFMPTDIPQQPVAFGLLIIKEMLVGLFVGLMSHLMLIAMNIAGVLIAHATSLSSAFTFNPQMATQSTVVSSFISLLIIVMIFVTDLHHLLLLGLIDSYRLFPTSADLLFGDMAYSLAEGISVALRIGLMIVSPFIIVSFGVFIAMGLVARLVPQIQVFILSIPVQIITGLIVFSTTISAMMIYFLDQYSAFWQSFLSS